MESWRENVGSWDSKVGQIIDRYGEEMDTAVILSAIETTGWAPRPSKAYFAAILRRYYCTGISTVEDVMRDEQEHEERRASNLRRRAARWYDAPELMTDEDARRDMPW